MAFFARHVRLDDTRKLQIQPNVTNAQLENILNIQVPLNLVLTVTAAVSHMERRRKLAKDANNVHKESLKTVYCALTVQQVDTNN